jgi:glycosyltransferase involved in cell wall biosynthesis
MMAEATPSRRRGVLYLSYDGMLEPLGQSQVVAYLERLAASRVVHLVSHEKAADWDDAARRAAVAARLARAGIQWHPLRYHKRPAALATAFDILAAASVGAWLVLRHRLGIVHARSYVAAVSALLLKPLGTRFLFDMRGFWADERVDGGLWPREGGMFRVAKWFERRFLLHADHVVSLTRAAVREMSAFPYLAGRMPPVTVIPTCADLDKFHPVARATADGFVLGYVGSVGTWYLFDDVVAAFRELRALRPDARLLVVNRNEHAHVRDRLAAAGIAAESCELLATDHAGVPAAIARMDAGIFFIKPVFSKQASAPTKLAEFLGCGVPCLANRGVGDLADILEGEGVGVAVDAFDAGTLRAGLERLLALAAEPGIAARCADAARRHFSLERGVEAYAGIYESLDAPRRRSAEAAR